MDYDASSFEVAIAVPGLVLFDVPPLVGFVLVAIAHGYFLATPPFHLGLDFESPFVGFLLVWIPYGRFLGFLLVSPPSEIHSFGNPQILGLYFEPLLGPLKLVRLCATTPTHNLELDFEPFVVAFELEIDHGHFLVQFVPPFAYSSFCLYATPPHNLGLDFEPLEMVFELCLGHGYLVATPPSQILGFDLVALAVVFELRIAHGRFFVHLVAMPQILGLDFVPLGLGLDPESPSDFF